MLVASDAGPLLIRLPLTLTASWFSSVPSPFSNWLFAVQENFVGANYLTFPRKQRAVLQDSTQRQNVPRRGAL